MFQDIICVRIPMCVALNMYSVTPPPCQKVGTKRQGEAKKLNLKVYVGKYVGSFYAIKL